jgi:hypothetical protein
MTGEIIRKISSAPLNIYVITEGGNEKPQLSIKDSGTATKMGSRFRGSFHQHADDVDGCIFEVAVSITFAGETIRFPGLRKSSQHSVNRGEIQRRTSRSSSRARRQRRPDLTSSAWH